MVFLWQIHGLILRALIGEVYIDQIEGVLIKYYFLQEVGKSLNAAFYVNVWLKIHKYWYTLFEI